MFHTPLPNEDPNQLYVVLEVKKDRKRSRVDIKALNNGLSFAPISTVLLDDLAIVEVSTSDLIGHTVTICKSDNSKASGKVIKVKKKKIIPSFNKKENGVDTNVWLTIQDDNEKKQYGRLFVNLYQLHELRIQ